MVFENCNKLAEFRISKVKLFIHDGLKQLRKESLGDFSIRQVLQDLLKESLRAFPDRADVGAGDTFPGFTVLSEDFTDEQWIHKPRKLDHNQPMYETRCVNRMCSYLSSATHAQ